MERILRIFFNNGSLITFVGLELVCLYLIVNFNSTQSAIAAETWSVRAGSVKSLYGNVQGYTDLREENEDLLRQIADLRGRLPAAGYAAAVDTGSVSDRAYRQRFRYVATSIINRSPYGPDNTLVIDRGSNVLVSVGQGVMGPDGLLGIVDATTERHARVVSILHRATRLSAGLRSNAYGTLRWDGLDPRRMTLTDIPDFVTVAVGDSVFTTGFSNVFPTGQLIGTVEEAAVQPGTGSQDLTVRLANRPLQARRGFVVQDLFKEELSVLKPAG